MKCHFDMDLNFKNYYFFAYRISYQAWKCYFVFSHLYRYYNASIIFLSFVESAVPSIYFNWLCEWSTDLYLLHFQFVVVDAYIVSKIVQILKKLTSRSFFFFKKRNGIRDINFNYILRLDWLCERRRWGACSFQIYVDYIMINNKYRYNVILWYLTKKSVLLLKWLSDIDNAQPLQKATVERRRYGPVGRHGALTRGHIDKME